MIQGKPQLKYNDFGDYNITFTKFLLKLGAYANVSKRPCPGKRPPPICRSFQCNRPGCLRRWIQ